MKKFWLFAVIACLLAGCGTPASLTARHKSTTTTTTRRHHGSTTTTLRVTTTTKPVTTSSAPVTTQPVTTSSSPAGGYWKPPQLFEWQWEIDHPLVLSNTTDVPPGVSVYDIDGIENPASTIAALHAKGDHVICYIEVGTAGNYGGTYTTYYNELKAAGVLGNKLSGYPEYFLNINSTETVAIVESIIQQQCATKGFDAVETDLDETYGSNEGKTGFTITQANEESYLTTLANYMHGLGLAWIAKNLDDTGSQAFVSAMEPLAQGILSEQANQYGTISLDNVFLAAGKPVLDAEYKGPTSSFCPYDIAHGINGVLFPQSLNGQRTPCQ
jgi:hypothetical protein